VRDKSKIRVLIACEESQTVCAAFRKLGFDAWSNDIQPCSGKLPQYHLQCDLFDIINDGWDLMIAFPPCTHLAVSGAAHFAEKQADGRQQKGIKFFMRIAKAKIPHIAIENPVGIMSTKWRKPDQIVQPYFWGDKAQKTTCLWLKNLPLLTHDPEKYVDKGAFHEWTDGKTGKTKRQPQWYFDAFSEHGHDPEMRQRIRSKTFKGIANAMAKQWSKYLLSVDSAASENKKPKVTH
jgi:site-specific DNA-cytosine methylase